MAMSLRYRIPLLMICDALLVNLSMFLALSLRFYDSGLPVVYHLTDYISIGIFGTVVFLAMFYVFKLYNRAWAYASLGELAAIIMAVTLGSLGSIAISYFAQTPLPRSVAVMHWTFTIILVGSSRLFWRAYLEMRKNNNGSSSRRALIIGAGDAGAMVARELKSHNSDIQPIGFIDDNPNKQKLMILGLPVLGQRDAIPFTVKRHSVSLIIIAMPSVGSSVIREIVKICQSTKAELKILPGMYQIIHGDVSINSLRPIHLEDLLHREPVQVDMEEVAGYIKGRTVMITGAGGSIGSELCRQVAMFRPNKLVLLGRGENSIHKIWLELKEKFKELTLDIVIADVRDKPKIEHVFGQARPDVVFHAAAHKHVPLMELHPDEAVKTNVCGTRNVAEASERHGVKVFVMISTDKAVNPSSVMGATKRLAELIIQHKNGHGGTIFTAVRFGNVLGSNGSVVPVFQSQIASGGPVTVTHPDMKRYFMTISEAVQLVIQAGSMARGGEVFVLDMGEPIKILDLASDMIRFSGLEPEKDIQIKITGIRPGEKLFEELLTAEEGSCATSHKRIFTARQTLVDVTALETELHDLTRKGMYIKAENVFEALNTILPNFKQYRKEQVS